MIKLIFKAYKIFFIHFFLYIKMTNDYYQNRKGKPWKEICERYENLSKEEKDKRQKRPKKAIKI